MIAKVTADTVDRLKEVIGLKIRGFEQIKVTLRLITMEKNNKVKEQKQQVQKYLSTSHIQKPFLRLLLSIIDNIRITMVAAEEETAVEN